MDWLTCGTIFALLSIGYCDYKCLCNYNAEKTIFTTESSQGSVLGYMYEFDCKPQGGDSADDQWLVVAFEHKVGYVEKDSNLQIQTCPGEIPDEDKLPPTTTFPTDTSSTAETIVLSTTESITTTVIHTSPTTTTATSTLGPMTTTKPTTASTLSPVTTTKPTTTSTLRPMTTTKPTTTSPSAPTVVMTTAESSTTTQRSTSSNGISTKKVLATRSTDAITTRSSTSIPTTVTTSKPTTVSIGSSSSQSVTQSKTTEQTTTQHLTTLQGHLELCPNRLQHLAQQNGELLAQLGQKCYEVVQSSVSWSHAESNCQHNGGHLVQIASQQEQDFIYNFLVKHHSHTVWLGLHDRNQEENFEWTSGDPVTYTNWKAGRMHYNHDSEDCVYMTATNGTWDDIKCGGSTAFSELLQGHRHAYVCQYATVDPVKTDGNLGMCPHNLHVQAQRDRGELGQFGHSCYEVITNAKVSWQHAETVCKSRGGHLAYINNAQEQSFLQGFLDRYTHSHAVWIGLTDHNSEGSFHWSSGSPVQFTNWVPNHISNFVSHEQEDCAVFIPYQNGQWDDIPCGHTSHHIFGGISSSGETHPLLCQYRVSTQPAFVG